MWNGPPWPNMKCLKFYFCICLMMHDNLPFFSSAIENAQYCRKLHKRYQCKSFISQFRIKSCGMDPPDPTWKFLKFYFCMYCPVMCEICHKPFFHQLRAIENVDILFFLSKMQIWNDCNALNIARNCTKDINANLSFLSLGSKMWNEPPVTQDEKVLKFFFCMYCPMMHDNLP